MKNLPETTREAALQSALGLTTTEAENASALSVVETKDIDPEINYRTTLAGNQRMDCRRSAMAMQ